MKNFISNYTKLKTPHFFIYAKDKKKAQVEPKNNSVINRLEKLIPNKRLNFKADSLGVFNYKLLMNDINVVLSDDIIEKYDKLSKNNHFIMNSKDNDNSNIVYLYQNIRNKLIEGYDEVFVTDNLIKYLYEIKNSKHKETLWLCFGDVILENLKGNLKKDISNGYILCTICGKRVQKKSNSQTMCEPCYVEHRREYYRNKKREQRANSCPQIEND